MYEIEVQSAISEICQACDGGPGARAPFFFIVGAGISAPTIPLAAEIESECRSVALAHQRTTEPRGKSAIECYSHWFELAFPHAEQRQQYLKEKIKGKLISPAVFRLAHLLLGGATGKIVVTPNFDDFLSRALTLFGEPHIVCDHPQTISRISVDAQDIQIVHVHGTYWFYDCCNLKGEISERAESLPTGPATISSFLELLLWRRSPIVLGYSGWEGDVIMTALQRRLLSRMPFNIYWFCYTRAEFDSIPPWLREHPNVRLVAPKGDVPVVSHQGALVRRAGVPPSQDEKTVLGTTQVLPAQKVLDLLVSSFQLDPPP